MIRLEVSAYKGEALATPFGADFDELGGSIGRMEGNTLVLPDPQRYISRKQAAVAFESGMYLLRDTGSATPTYLNGTPIGKGCEQPLSNGDEVRIGEYTLRVLADENRGAAQDHPQTSVADPFADVLPAHSRATVPRYGTLAENAAGPMDDDLPTPVPSRAHEARANLIPDDFELFPDAPAQPARQDSSPSGVELGLPETADVSKLFDLDKPAPWDPLGPENPLSTPADSNYRPGRVNAGGRGAAETAAAQRGPKSDHAPVTSTAYRPPPARAPHMSEGAEGSHLAPPPAEAEISSRASPIVVTWESGSTGDSRDEIKTALIRAPTAAASRASTPLRSPTVGDAAQRDLADTSGTTTSSSDRQERDQLLEAFMRGAGIPRLQVNDGLTPELMELVGQLLRAALEGTLQLLLARQLFKREVRADATLIIGRENNPLKFSPNAEAALGHLLVPEGSAYMKPLDAMKDAYGDLRSHQFGMMAGMRAALFGVLERFNPEQVERRLTEKGALRSLIPSTRKARLWEAYEQFFSALSAEAEDDFQALFGKAFLKAYEEQITRLEMEENDKKP